MTQRKISCDIRYIHLWVTNRHTLVWAPWWSSHVHCREDTLVTKRPTFWYQSKNSTNNYFYDCVHVNVLSPFQLRNLDNTLTGNSHILLTTKGGIHFVHIWKQPEFSAVLVWASFPGSSGRQNSHWVLETVRWS